MDRRQPGPDAAAPLQLGPDLGQREVGRRLYQPARSGAALPVARSRCISLIAADALTAKRPAAPRIELPLSTTCTIHSRRSMDIGAGMATNPGCFVRVR